MYRLKISTGSSLWLLQYALPTKFFRDSGAEYDLGGKERGMAYFLFVQKHAKWQNISKLYTVPEFPPPSTSTGSSPLRCPLGASSSSWTTSCCQGTTTSCAWVLLSTCIEKYIYCDWPTDRTVYFLDHTSKTSFVCVLVLFLNRCFPGRFCSRVIAYVPVVACDHGAWVFPGGINFSDFGCTGWTSE